MAISTRIIQRRIKSIRNTKKITKAMEMVSAAKMRKAVANVLATRNYATLAWQTILNLANRTESKYHPLLYKREVKKIGVVLISSNRGLCGGFNSNISAVTLKEIKKRSEGASVELITLGKKGRDFTRRRQANIVADFEKPDVTSSVAEISALSHLILEDYIKGKYDQVLLAYTDFISSLKQKPRIMQLLPLEKKVDEYLGQVGESKEQKNILRQNSEQTKTRERGESIIKNQGSKFEFEYIFEPSPDEVLNDLLPRLIEMQIYQAVLESDASEHSARMLAMRNATDAAGEMIDDLTLAFNQARQAAITQEIAEISGGKAVLE